MKNNNTESIPKIIHYCWFGNGEKSKVLKRCIRSWKKKCPDYRIIEWNESNCDISALPIYVQQAYENKKWAFVSDYVRLKVVYENGGVYLDTDVQLIKNIDHLLNNHAFFGFENKEFINTGLGFGAVPFSEIVRKLMDDYLNIQFVIEGEMDLTSCPRRNIHVFLDYGLQQNGKKQRLKDGTIVLSPDFMCPIDYYWNIHFTRSTVSIHWFAETWRTKQESKKMMEKRIDYVLHSPNRALKLILGEKKYMKLKNSKKKILKLLERIK